MTDHEKLALFREALNQIRVTGGKVCGAFEHCTHHACRSSYSAWAIADKALKESGEDFLNRP